MVAGNRALFCVTKVVDSIMTFGGSIEHSKTSAKPILFHNHAPSQAPKKNNMEGRIPANDCLWGLPIAKVYLWVWGNLTTGGLLLVLP